MFRKIALLVTIMALFAMVAAVSAGTANPNAAINGCYADATPTIVNEGVTIPVTIKCDGVPIDNNVFGFQFGTSLANDFAGTAPSSYTAGTFTSAATGGVLVGENSLDLYGVSRKLTDTVATTNFTLGSYTLTADTDLTDDDGSVDITFVDGTFKLSDNLGASLPNWVRTINDDSTTVNDIDLAWLSGNMTVRSDSNALGNIKTVTLDLGAKRYAAANVASYQIALTIDDTYLYVEDASGVVGGSFAVAQDSDDVLNIAVSADMYGHLACSTSAVNLLDAGAAEDVDGFVGTLGFITLKAGDVVTVSDAGINLQDATEMGVQFGSSTPTGESDINQDGTVDILDLVQVGRNYNATQGDCA